MNAFGTYYSVLLAFGNQIFSEISTRIGGPESSVHFNKGCLTSSELNYGFYRTMFLNALHSAETTNNELKIAFSKLELKNFFLHLSYTDDY